MEALNHSLPLADLQELGHHFQHMKGDMLGRQGGSGSQGQPRMEIMKGDKLGRQGGSGSQEQPRMEIMKGDKLGRQGGSGSQEPFGDFGGQQLSHWEVRTPIGKSSPEWSPEWRSCRETSLGDKAAAASRRFRGSAPRSLRSKNPYSFQLSGEKFLMSSQKKPPGSTTLSLELSSPPPWCYASLCQVSKELLSLFKSLRLDLSRAPNAPAELANLV